MPKRFGGEFLPGLLSGDCLRQSPSDFRGEGVVPADTPSWGVRQRPAEGILRSLKHVKGTSRFGSALACAPVLRRTCGVTLG